MARALRRRMLIPTPLNDLTKKIIQAAIAVHDALGPGLLESVYRRCLIVALLELGLFVEVEKALPITFRGVSIQCGYRLDVVVEGQIVVEVKAVAELAPVHLAQMMTYLKLSDCPAGLILQRAVDAKRNQTCGQPKGA
jgi:GxxExxY protein